MPMDEPAKLLDANVKYSFDRELNRYRVEWSDGHVIYVSPSELDRGESLEQVAARLRAAAGL